MKEHFKIIPAAYLFLIQDGKILLSRRANTGFQDGLYSVPAGHLEPGESARMALIREAKEEIDIDISNSVLTLVHVMDYNSDPQRVGYFFVSEAWSGEVTNLEPDECDDLQWFSLEALPENMSPFIGQAIEHYKNKVAYSEFGWG